MACKMLTSNSEIETKLSSDVEFNIGLLEFQLYILKAEKTQISQDSAQHNIFNQFDTPSHTLIFMLPKIFIL